MIDTAVNIMLAAICVVIFAMALGIVALVGWGIIEFIKFLKEE